MDCSVVFASLTTFVLLTFFVTVTPTKDYCHPNPCLNSGTCVQVLGGYDCHCDLQYTGAHCEGKEFKLLVMVSEGNM